MRSNCFAALAIIAAVLSQVTAHAQISTVILAQAEAPTFEISSINGQERPASLTFVIGPPPYPGANVAAWRLRVVPTGETGGTDQDVNVFSSDRQQIGRWSASDRTPEPRDRPLELEGFKPGNNIVTLRLETPTKSSKWLYHGGKAPNLADRPRLIVTYGALSPPGPTVPRSGDSSDWKYAETSSHFLSSLLTFPLPNQTLLANPVTYDGALYLIASPGPTLFRLAEGNLTSWRLPQAITENSFAFATTWGRLQIITKGTLATCNLRGLGPAGTDAVLQRGGQSIETVSGETPAMGPDGTLYFKNVGSEGGNVADVGSIVAYNPWLDPIWTTELKFTKVSRITLNASGRFAYVLAEVAVDPTRQKSAKQFLLVRIATATGESVAERIQYEDEGGVLRSSELDVLLPPVVATKANVDYVFVAANKGDTGLMQLRYRKGSDPPTVVWTRQGKVATAPVLSVLDGNSLFAVQDGQLKQYPWFDGKGAVADANLKEIVIGDQQGEMSRAAAVLIDAADSLFVQARPGAGDKDRLHVFMRPSDRSAAWKTVGVQVLPSIANLLFTPEGAMIGYDSSHFYDLSARSPNNKQVIDMSDLINKTIYTARSVTVKSGTAEQLKDGDQVILKGETVSFPNNFAWPKGKILKVQTVR